MVNPTIYVSCIKQFWATVVIKKANDVVKLQALIKRKKVVITEDGIRQDLHLDDADGVECLPNEKIFAELARMGYEKPPPKLTFYKAFFSAQWKFFHTLFQYVSAKRTVWNEFSCSMASAVICLATEQDEIAQALEILKLKKRVKKLEKKRRSKSFGLKRLRKVGGKIAKIDGDEDISLVDMETQVDLGAELQGRKDDDNVASKDVNAAEPTVCDDKKYDNKQESIDWNAIAEQIQEKHFDNIKKYQSLKRKPVSIAQARKNMIIYLKNMVRYKMEHFRGMTYDKESFKKLKAIKVSGSESTHDTPTNDLKKISEEDVKNMLEIVPISEFKVDALQVKYPLIDWEIHFEGSRSYWKIIRVGGITEAYQIFKDMLKGFDREDLDVLWRLVKEKFSSKMPTEDKEKALWVELTRLFEPNKDDVFWKLQIYMHDPLTWKLYTNYGVHHVSSIKRHDIFMLTEKDYPLSNDVMIMMLRAKL
uniref:Xylulose kinase-1 n=1 Tax=Tanacetum cinerariifolium TaxID=118510 RepID=A0A6L2J2M7_TANCI|nr:hypothetical protein [Tanacetum cinerariifolium]